MQGKQFLSQVYHLDQKIASKKCQIANLQDAATNCTPNLTGMPHSPSGPRSPMEEAVIRLIDLKAELEDELARLLRLRVDAQRIIRQVSNPEYQLLLEKRYLCYESWEDIAVDMSWSISWTMKLHRKALRAVDAVLEESGVA